MQVEGGESERGRCHSQAACATTPPAVLACPAAAATSTFDHILLDGRLKAIRARRDERAFTNCRTVPGDTHAGQGHRTGARQRVLHATARRAHTTGLLHVLNCRGNAAIPHATDNSAASTCREATRI